MREFLSTIWFIIFAPFYGDFWRDEDLVGAYCGCTCGVIIIAIQVALFIMVFYALYLAIQYLEVLL